MRERKGVKAFGQKEEINEPRNLRANNLKCAEANILLQIIYLRHIDGLEHD